MTSSPNYSANPTLSSSPPRQFPLHENILNASTYDSDERQQPKTKSIHDLLLTTSTILSSPYNSTTSANSACSFHLLTQLAPQLSESTSFDATFGAYWHEPQTYAEAISSSGSTFWKEAMDWEYNSLIENQTWDLLPKPSHKNLIWNKWVYKIKYKTNGKIDKYKARLVAKGFTQKPGIDFTETCSPVIWYDSIWAIFAIAAAKGMYLKLFDIGTAFLNGKLNEKIYMCKPQGYVDLRHTT